MRSARGTVAQPSVSVAQQVMVVSNVLEAKTDAGTERDSVFDMAMSDGTIRRVHRERRGNPLSKPGGASQVRRRCLRLAHACAP